MIVFLLFLNSLDIPNVPPGLPKPPQNYTEWTEFSSRDFSFHCCLGFKESPEFGYISTEDTARLPYVVKIRGFNTLFGSGDSMFGGVSYYNPDSTEYYKMEKDNVQIQWWPHQEFFVVDPRPIGTPYGYISYDRKGLEEITVEGNRWLRIRGYFWMRACDATYQTVAAFTTYFIPTEIRDFYITCLSIFYSYETSPEEATPEELKTWKPEKSYPNRIRKLEQAVEQSFKVK